MEICDNERCRAVLSKQKKVACIGKIDVDTFELYTCSVECMMDVLQQFRRPQQAFASSTATPQWNQQRFQPQFQQAQQPVMQQVSMPQQPSQQEQKKKPGRPSMKIVQQPVYSNMEEFESEEQEEE